MQCVSLLHFIREMDVIRSMLAMHVGAIAEGTISDAFWKVLQPSQRELRQYL